MTLAQVPGYFMALPRRLHRPQVHPLILPGGLRRLRLFLRQRQDRRGDHDLRLPDVFLQPRRLGRNLHLFARTVCHPRQRQRRRGILAPSFVGIIFLGPQDFAAVFLVFTGVLIATALNVLVLAEETMKKSLDGLNEAKPLRS